MRAGMSPGRRNSSSSGSNSGTSGSRCLRELGAARRRTCRPSSARALLQQPQAHHVLAAAASCRRSPRSLVRLASRAASLSTGSGSSTPSSDHVPLERTAACSSHRRGGERRRGVVAGDGVDRARRRASWWREQRAERRCRARRARRTGAPAARAARSGRAPTRRCGRRAGRWWRRSSPRWRARRTATARAGRARARSAAAASSAAEPSSASSWKTVLIGIVWMPVTAYSSLARHALERALDHPVGALVAVVERQAEHAVLAVEQRVVDAPGVDADARELARAAQAVERLGEQVQQVPAQAVGQPHRPVGEAVHLSSSTRPPSKRPATTRPLVAPRSMAA